MLETLPTWSAEGPYEQLTLPPGSRGRGVSYERRVGQLLREQLQPFGWTLRDHPWIKTARGYLQPDFVVETPSGCGLLIECKLTWYDCSPQLATYKRVLSAMGLTVTPLLAVRNLTPAAPAPILALEDAYENAVWHLWL